LRRGATDDMLGEVLRLVPVPVLKDR